jgi:hypothetical protein
LSPIPSHTFEGLADSNRQQEYYLSSHCYMFEQRELEGVL